MAVKGCKLLLNCLCWHTGSSSDRVGDMLVASLAAALTNPRTSEAWLSPATEHWQAKLFPYLQVPSA